MLRMKKQYVTNESGNKIAILLDIKTFQQLEGYIELLEDKIDLGMAMKEPTEFTDWDIFVKELKREEKL
ncbi:MAG: hypothetical protein LAKADJCE_00824 [Candidatus Argoarchaeum ethanivorans]|uniref:Prevent-host-death protein n=1 Tax=Candidatus Argoarchaeum ethanivorans TaxID=2608793 RepID=A0A811TIA9_9EURY|nr:MAG: hypothetical protein LAKADJCE_00824 [Candidatus Argoarchaeum ethanivorans]